MSDLREVPKKVVRLRRERGRWQVFPSGNSLFSVASKWWDTKFDDDTETVRWKERAPIKVVAAIAQDWPEYAIQDEVSGEIYNPDEARRLAEKGVHVCGDCSGRGEVECPECMGDGTIDCRECDGTGEVEEAESAA